ncbi:MAG: hypothetical protein U1D55_02915 [Phycisphaerae bacterium]
MPARFARRSRSWLTSEPNDALTHWDYDNRTGNVRTKFYDDGRSVTFDYWPEGLLKSREWSRLSGSSQPLKTSYDYERGANGTGDLHGITYNDATPPVALDFERAGQLARAQDVTTGTSTWRTISYTSALELSVEDLPDSYFGAARDVTHTYGPTRVGQVKDVLIGAEYSATLGYDGVTGRMNGVTGVAAPPGGAARTAISPRAICSPR